MEYINQEHITVAQKKELHDTGACPECRFDFDLDTHMEFRNGRWICGDCAFSEPLNAAEQHYHNNITEVEWEEAQAESFYW